MLLSNAARRTSLRRFTRNISLALLVSALLSACNNFDDAGENTVSQKVPQGLIASSGARAVQLQWVGVPNAGSYTVYWSDSPSVNPANSASIETSEPTYNHLGLNNGSSYYYVVSSRTTSGESQISNEVIGQPQAAAPSKPTSLRLKSEDRRITIDFDRIAGVAEYHLLWATSADQFVNNPSRINRINNVNGPFVHTNLINGQDYYYVLRVSSGGGKSTDSDVFRATPSMALPLAPVITAAPAIPGEVSITWNNLSNAQSFDLYWSTSPNVSINSAYVRQVTSPYTHAPLSLSANQQYYYRIQARNNSGTSPLSNEVQITTPSVTTITSAGATPAAPSILATAIADAQVTLNWQAAAGASSLGYDIYWAIGNTVIDPGTLLDKNNFSGIIRNVQPPYTQVSLQNNTYYYYRISALNNAGEGPLSPIISARPEPIIPGVPSGVVALSGDQRLIIRWNPVELADSYIVSVTPQNSGTTIISNVNSPHTISNLNNGQTYSISVQSVSRNRNSEASNVISGIPRVPVPNPPTQLVAIPKNASIQLQWQSATPQTSIDPSESLVLSYNVYQGKQADINTKNASLLASLTPLQIGTGNWQVDIAGVSNGQRYYYIVTAVNVGGESAASVTAWASPQVPVPSAPSQVYAIPGDNEVRIVFEPAVTANEIPTYNLYWSKDQNGGVSNTQVISNISQSPVYVFGDGNSNGTTYYFQVSAINSGGESRLSTKISATPQVPTPNNAPANIVADASSRQVLLNWDSVSSAASYLVYWSTSTEINPSTSAVMVVNNGLTTLNHSSLNNGQDYYYRIAAQNNGGVGPLSSLITARPQVAAPAAPTSFAAVAGNAQVTLNWASDVAATSYLLNWRFQNEPTWSFIQGVQSGYVHGQLNNAQAYEYQLVAQNPGGDSSPTAILLATPVQTPPPAPTGLSIAAGDQQTSLSWFTQPGISYTVHWSTGNIDPLTSGLALNLATPITVHGSTTPLTNGTVYNYQIVATKNNVDSVPSAIVSATPNSIVASSPIGLSAQAGDQNNTLTWFAPTDAINTTTYTLFWGTQAGNLPGNAINNVTAPFVHNNLSNNQTYYYRAIATTSGTASLDSNLASATPVPAVPLIPLGINVISTDSSNTVSWLSVASASNYTLESSLSGAFDDIQTRDVAAPSTQFIHNGLSNGKTVFYRVFALNSNTQRGPNSNIRSGTPQVNEQPSNSAPTASRLSIADNNGGNLTVGTLLTGDYTYTDVDLDDEGVSRFRWLHEATPIVGATSLTYLLTSADSGLPISFEVTPIALTGTSTGTVVRTTVSTASGTPSISNSDVNPTVPENSNTVMTITVADIDSSSFTYTLSGVDSNRFTTVGNNLQFIANPDFENPQDNGADNIYNVSIVANDGSNNSLPKDFSITVTDVNDVVPVITNVNLSPSIPELSQNVTTMTVDDTDSQTFTYLLNGLDRALFTTVGNNLQFINPPDFENPLDNGSNNVYNLSVIANDGLNNSRAVNFVITITSLNISAPIITNTNLLLNIDENLAAATAIVNIVVTDPDSTVFTYILSGVDGARFIMAGSSLRFVVSADYEAPTDSGANNVYNLSIVASDGTNNSAAKDFTITVNDQNDVPPAITNNDTNLNLNVMVAENTSSVTNINVVDADSSSFTYVLSGADSALFSVTGNSLQFTNPPNFELKLDAGLDNIYNVTVVANDGINNSAPIGFSATVTNVDEAPSITSAVNYSIPENSTAVTTLTVSDPDSSNFTYVLSGPDAAFFSLSGNSLLFASAPDFENPVDAAAPFNAYEVTVVANDGINNSQPANLTITVSDVNEAPVITNLSNYSMFENVQAVTTMMVADPDSSVFTYVVSGADSALFNFAGNNLRFIVAPNFEIPGDAATPFNVYEITVVANDGELNSLPVNISVTVNNVDEAPVITNLSIYGIPENTTTVTPITITDPDSSNFTYVLSGPDASQFTVMGNTLQFTNAPDFEIPGDVAAPFNDYEVTIVANDGVNDSLPANLTISVTNVNDTVSPQNMLAISSGKLVSVDSVTGYVTVKSGNSTGGFKSLRHITYDHITKLVYGLNFLPRVSFNSTLQFTQIVTIDPANGDKNVVAYPGAEFLDSVGIALDPAANIIYSINANGDFYSYDLFAKTLSPITNIGFNLVSGLTIDVFGDGSLYTIDRINKQLISFLPGSNGNIVGTLSTDMIVPEVLFDQPYGLTFDPSPTKDQIIASLPVRAGGGTGSYLEIMSINKTTAKATDIGGLSYGSTGTSYDGIAFAYDPTIPNNSKLYMYKGINNGTGQLALVNIPDYGGQNFQRIPIPFSKLNAVSFDKTAKLLYGIDDESKYVLSANIRSTTPSITIVGQVNIPNVINAIANGPNTADIIYAVAAPPGRDSNLYRIDKLTWKATDLGPIGESIVDIGFHIGSATLYGIVRYTGGLVSINTSTAIASAPTVITGNTAGRPIMGIGFSDAGVLYGTDNIHNVWSINPGTAVASAINTSGFTSNMVNITFDGDNLIGAASSDIQRVLISTTPYVVETLLEHTYRGLPRTLAHDANTNTFYTINSTNPAFLYSVNQNTGAATKLGSLTSSFFDIAFDPSSNQLFAIAGTNISSKTLYRIRTSGISPLNGPAIGVVPNAQYLNDIAVDSNGLLYGVDGGSTSFSDLIRINTSDATLASRTRLQHSYGGSIAYNSTLDNFILAPGFLSTNQARVISRLSRSGVSSRFAQADIQDIVHVSATDTIFYLSNAINAKVNTSKVDLTATTILSVGGFYTNAFAYSNTNNILYVVDNVSDNLLQINTLTGQTRVIGYTEFNLIMGLVYDPNSPVGAQLIGYDSESAQFVSLDPTTGRGTAYPTSQPGQINDLAIHFPTAGTSTIYASTRTGIAVYDPISKSLGPEATYSSAVGAPGIFTGSVGGISIDSNGLMYGVAQLDSDYYLVDIVKETGVVTHSFKKIGSAPARSMAIDKNTNTIYSTNGNVGPGGGYLLSINPLTGAGTTHGALNSLVKQLVYNPGDNITYGILESNNVLTSRFLFSVNPTDGSTTFIDGFRSNIIPSTGGLATSPGAPTTFYGASTTSNNPSLSTYTTTASLSISPFLISNQTSLSIAGLAWNSNTNSLFGLSNSNKLLFEIPLANLPTATGSFKGATIGTGTYKGLVYSPANNALITIENETGVLLIDEITGAARGPSTPLTGDIPAVTGISIQP